jgi:hypothetical protein
MTNSVSPRIPLRATGVAVLLSALALASAAAPAYAGDPSVPCPQPNVAGTVLLPALCDVVGDDDTMVISTGLPAGTTIVIDPTWDTFFNIVRVPGGVFPGGQIQDFDGILEMSMTGTGALAAFNRNIFMQVATRMHTAAPSPGAPIQEMDVQIESMQGQILGDPDFNLISLVAGFAFALPSPGETTLLRTGPAGNDFVVDSFFDVAYQISFVGAPGSVLDGLLGTTTDTVDLRQGGAPWSEWSAGKPCGSILVPELIAQGALSVDSWNVLEVVDGPPLVPAVWFVGFSPLRAPFKGGILGPQPDIQLNVNLDAFGEYRIPYQWPNAPAGTRLWVQVWMHDISLADPFCSTQTLVGTSQ